ncbi:MAG: hypothetical protein RL684_2067 [Pseudomonadota bacterium]
MPAHAQSLADSLALLKSLQDAGHVALIARELPRAHRERLLRNGFIRAVMKGWYVPARPDEQAGDSTSWYAAFWPFCTAYLEHRFGAAWCVSPEQSISLHVGNRNAPRQLLVRSPKGGNKPTALLHGTSLFDMRLAPPPAQDLECIDGVRGYGLAAALIACPPSHYAARPTELRAALAMVREPSELLQRLLEGGNTVVAGRLAGAFRNIGHTRIADEILSAVTAAGFRCTASDPFAEGAPVVFSAREASPYVYRLRLDWARMREDVLRHFPSPPGLPKAGTAYLRQVDGLYANDAYNSLSIEGYRVSAELIERVRSGRWNPEANRDDEAQRNALAARGYWQAFQSVRKSLGRVLVGNNPGTIADADHVSWYRELFGPSVSVGLLAPADLAGYRSGPVYIRRSMHTPPSREAVRELMPTLFQLLAEEPSAAVRVVLGHFQFVYVHPYPDGNGRMGRFLMNVMAASGGYPWIVVPWARRETYMTSLESASVDGDIVPFTRFLASLVMPAGRRGRKAKGRR